MQKETRICVVDDDESVRSATASLLRAAGYATASFDSAEAFLAAGDLHRFACLVVDIQMPGMDGIALVDRLGRDAPHVPIILVTARTEHDLLERAAASRAAFVLRKPFPAQRLLECLQIVLG
ncbi:response regulator transcription factor [Lysobacter sp. P5_B9]